MIKTILLVLFALAFGLVAGILWQHRQQQVPAVAEQLPKIMLHSSTKAQVLKVIDGDTFEVRAFLWEGLEKTARIRLNGVNTPEKRKRAGCQICEAEKKLARKAERFAKKLIGKEKKVSGKRRAMRPIYLSGVEGGLYGRYSADIWTADNINLGEALVEAGLAKPLAAGERACWCGVVATPVAPSPAD